MIISQVLLALSSLSLAIFLEPDTKSSSGLFLLDIHDEQLQVAPLTGSNSATPDEQLFHPTHHPTTLSSSTSVLLPAVPQDGPRTITVTVILPAAITTEFITLPPSPTTETITFVSTITAPSSSSSVSPPTEPGPEPPQTTWSTSSRMTDLSSFNIVYFPSGQQNIKLVSSLPSSFSRAPSQEQPLMRVLYPAHSINPAQSPVGGASFYASPLGLSSATNVSLTYSVFFPPDFDWVKGGKLPGLYGGRTGCSGGTDAEDCFSTRLMWRSGGVGELYLYASKSHQPSSLCDSAGSTCSTDYGFSIARGSFSWTRGTWTTVTQTVVLNTGGKADGSFTLHVNGKLAIDRRDIYYRNSDQGSPTRPTKIISETSATRGHSQPSVTKTDDGSLLGGLLNPLLGNSRDPRRLLSDDSDRVYYKSPIWTGPPQRPFSVDGDARKGGNGRSRQLVDMDIDLPLISVGAGVGSDGGQVNVGFGATHAHGDGDRNRDREKGRIGLIGIFFSTFFGGHDVSFETPKDQYVWFKDFSLTINN